MMANIGKGGLALAFLVMGIFSSALTVQGGMKDSVCLECHSDQTLVTTNAAGVRRVLYVDESKLRGSIHKTNACTSCHSGISAKHPDDELVPAPVDCSTCHAKQSVSYGGSVHGLAHASGNTNAANCISCHGTHNVLASRSPGSPLHFTRLYETCGACHAAIARDVEISVHGQAVAAGKRDAPTCTDCHSEHKNMHNIGELKTDSSLKIASDVCGNCHASERMATKYNLPPDRVKTFFDSYHGLAAQYGSTLAANCSSCHGVHKVLPSSDPRSSISKTNLVATCGKCHPGATENFVNGKVHVGPSVATDNTDPGGMANGYVRQFYGIAIFGTVAAMLFHNILLMRRKFLQRYQTVHLEIVRMDFNQRMQHMVLAVSFIALAVTGFALRFPESWVAKLMGGSEAFRRWSHRGAGMMLLGAGLFHVIYLIVTPQGRQLFLDFLPTKKDFADAWQNLAYLFGWRKHKPAFGRFSYAEKFEYWAVIWGTLLMGVTGLMIWFKMDVTRFLPRWMVEVAITIHYYEAILACLAIVVWHYFFVIFDPDVYPMNTAVWHGKVTEEWQREEHPLDRTGEVPKEPKKPSGENDKASS